MSTAVITSPSSTPTSVEAKRSNHRANIVLISEIFPHPDPETTNLELIVLGGYQVVVRKGSFKVGDLGVYIQPDSVVPQTEPFSFIWERFVDHFLATGEAVTVVPEKRRRITVRKFRGQWSEGLLLPVSDFHQLLETNWSEIGNDVSDLLNITHYDPDAGKEGTHGTQSSAPRRKYPKTLKGIFYYVLSLLGFRKYHKSYMEEVSFKLPEYDVETFKNYANTFADGEMVIVTEKVHGSSARFISVDGTMYAGSHKRWRSPDSNCVWRKAIIQHPWISEFCSTHEGYALYGEVTPTQSKFDYGYKDGDVGFFLFDILGPDGRWVPTESYEALGVKIPEDDFGPLDLYPAYPEVMVPVLYVGPYDKEKILSLVDGPSHVPGAKHIQEGVVVRALDEDSRQRGLGRKQLKIVSNAFLDKDSK